MLYFAYGSNMDLAQMERRCPGARLVGAAALSDYRFGFTTHCDAWVGGVADIVPAAGEAVHGLLFEVTEAHLAELDRYEQVPEMYRRVRVSIDGREVWVYEVVEKQRFVEPSRRYRDVIVGAARRHGLPEDYVARIEAMDGGSH